MLSEQILAIAQASFALCLLIVIIGQSAISRRQTRIMEKQAQISAKHVEITERSFKFTAYIASFDKYIQVSREFFEALKQTQLEKRFLYDNMIKLAKSIHLPWEQSAWLETAETEEHMREMGLNVEPQDRSVYQHLKWYEERIDELQKELGQLMEQLKESGDAS